MGQKVRYLGLVILAGAAVVLVSGEAGWLPDGQGDLWFGLLLKVGAAVFVIGILLGASTPLNRWLSGGRCVRCGARTERGQSYCIDHLRATVYEAQDHTREMNHRVSRRR